MLGWMAQRRRRGVAQSSAQLGRARKFAAGRYPLGCKSRQNALSLAFVWPRRMPGEVEKEADKPPRPPGYAGGRDV